jgi:ammonium transporter, Amt family
MFGQDIGGFLGSSGFALAGNDPTSDAGLWT